MTTSLSRLVRPWFEKKRSKAAFGGILAMFSMAVTSASSPIAWEENGASLSSIGANKVEIVKTIMSGPAKPLPAMTGVSQKFHALHPGMDITAPEGSLIYPIRPGRVVMISELKTGYGRSVLVDHGNGLTSLYAHMGKFMVEEGDFVTDETPLGEVGLTGHTTGYHLHLEVRKGGLSINPVAYL